jgi:altronate dehydratase small subunit
LQLKKHDAILIHPSDNVAVAIKDLTKGQTVNVLGDSFHAEIVLTSDVAFGHKFAITAIREKADIVKYGEIIGRASKDIGVGEHAHDHNIAGIRGKRSTAAMEES